MLLYSLFDSLLVLFLFKLIGTVCKVSDCLNRGRGFELKQLRWVMFFVFKMLFTTFFNREKEL